MESASPSRRPDPAASAPAAGPDGRRRSNRARQAILDAAFALFEQDGLRGLTVEAIADRAGVGKATIYRWWPGKSAVLMDALGQELQPQTPFPDTGSAEQDLRRQIRAVIELLTTTRAGHAYRALIGETQHDAGLARDLADRYIAARRAAASAVFERGIDRGELRPDLDIGIAVDALYGAVYYRLLVSHEPTEPGYADQLLDQLYPGLAVRSTGPAVR